MGNKDYYALLGIFQQASDDEIKRAYKQKALKHHPDKNRGDLEAEKKFMDISEAYEILSDPYKRSLYDRYGSEELKNYLNTDPRTHFRSSGMHGDPSTDYTYDPYNNYFVRFKDPSTFYDLYVTLEEINKGATRKMKITRKRFSKDSNSCVRDEKLLEIQIKPGWKEGTKITFEGEGDECDPNTIAGDIVFIIRDKPHPTFERSNSDLIHRVKLSIKQALLGTLIHIPFLDSTKAPYRLRTDQEVITPQTEKRFLNEGLPFPKDPTRRGDLIVKFDLLFPHMLNTEQRTLIDCCFSNALDAYQPHDSVLHTTIIEPTPQQQQQQQQTPPSTHPATTATTATAKNSSSQNGNRHVNGHAHLNKPSSPTKSPTKIKISPVRPSTSAATPPPPPSSPANPSTKETVF